MQASDHLNDTQLIRDLLAILEANRMLDGALLAHDPTRVHAALRTMRHHADMALRDKAAWDTTLAMAHNERTGSAWAPPGRKAS